MARDPLNDSSGGDPLLKQINALSRTSGSGGGSTRPRSTLAQYRPQTSNVGNIGAGSLAPSTQDQPSSSAPIAYQPIQGTSLDQQLRSLLNLISGQGYSGQASGNFILGSGLDTTQAGLNLQQQPIEYWQALLSGDPASNPLIQRSLSPEIEGISAANAAAANNSSGALPGGGYRSVAMAGQPFKQAQDVGNLYSQLAKLAPEAAQALSGIGNNIASTGLQAGQLGLQESQQGIDQLLNALKAALGEKGIDIGQTESNLSLLTSGLESLNLGY